MKIAINGFGRIGRAVFKILLDKGLDVVAINDLSDIATLVHLLQYDSVYGVYEKKVSARKNGVLVDGKIYPILSCKNPGELPWHDFGIDIVIEATGFFRTKDEASKHIRAGAKKVIISAPAKSDDIKTIILAVNEKDLRKTDKIISMASCTTNCLAPVMKILNEAIGVKKSVMSTIHAYTSTQNLVDGPHKDLRRARAGAINIIPTTTGAALAAAKTIPALKGKFDGISLRVPVPVVSLCDITCVLGRKTNVEEIKGLFKKAARQKQYQGSIVIAHQHAVSSDFIAHPAGSIIDLNLITVVDGDLLKVVTWYDNEWGYSARMADLCLLIKKKKLYA